MRTAIIIIVLSVLFLNCSDDAGRIPEVERDILFVRVDKADHRNIIKSSTATGLAKPYRSYNIVPKQGGIINAIHCEIGDHVKKGQLLIEFDIENLLIQKRKAKAQKEIADTNYTSARSNYDRMTRLYQEKAISKAQYENAENAYNSAKANLSLAEAFIDEIQQAINDSRLFSPIDGYIANKFFEEGDNVTPVMGNVPVLVIHQLDRIKIQAFISGRLVKNINIGQRVYINEYDMKGTVSNIGISADPTSGNFPLEIVIENDDYFIRPGQFISARIILKEKQDILSIPKPALYQGDTVFVYDDGIVSKRAVKVDFIGDEYIEIIKGVKDSEIIIISSLYALRDNMKVRIE